MNKGVDYIGVGVGALVFNDDGYVLIDKRGSLARNEVGKWEFPGGGVEFNEKLEDAIKREIKEEFGIDIEILELLEVTDHFIPEEKQHWVAPTYIARKVHGTARIMEPDKIAEIRWVPVSELKQYDLSIVSKSNLKAYQKKYGENPPN